MSNKMPVSMRRRSSKLRRGGEGEEGEREGERGGLVRGGEVEGGMGARERRVGCCAILVWGGGVCSRLVGAVFLGGGLVKRGGKGGGGEECRLWGWMCSFGAVVLRGL